MTTKAQRAEWLKQRGQGMTSAIGEYTPSEFFDLLLEVDNLVEAMQVAIEVAECYPEQEKWSRRWRELLLKMGEQVPPSSDYDPSITEH